MHKTIFKYLEDTVKKNKNKVAFTDSKREITYQDFLSETKTLASNIVKYDYFNKPIAIFLDKNIAALETMMAINYSGNFYTIIDNKMPLDRIENILSVLKPVMIITDKKNVSKLDDLNYKLEILLVDELKCEEIIQEKLDQIYERIVDTNPMYILFTSGSTGIPKGAVLSHVAVISYCHWYKDTFDINEDTIFGSQTPFYFSMSVSDIFSTMLSGATFHIIPKSLFSFPIALIDFLNEKKINTIYWVPSALCIIANLGALKESIPKYLTKILFAGEVMPTKQLNMWMKALPNTMFANLFGPTETVDICSYYIVNRKFKDEEILPIGTHCDNCDLFLIDENGKEVTEIGKEGEIHVRGIFLTSGYYNNPEKTKEALIQNPLNTSYPEMIYKTGDLAKYNKNNELIYISRKDFQIKHMGYRIELGEIESNINAIKDVENSVCIYDSELDNLILFYKSNTLDENKILDIIKKKVPQYMVPQKIIRLTTIPYNANGKIDRKKLQNDYKKGNV